MARHVEYHVIKDIVSCYDCPHFARVQDMNATIPWCGLMKEHLDGFGCHEQVKPPIPPKCPLPGAKPE